MISLLDQHDRCKFVIQRGERRFITPIRLKNKWNDKGIEVKALWDTGAENSVISREVVKSLELPVENCGVATGINNMKAVAAMSLGVAFPGNMSWFTWCLPIVLDKPAKGVGFVIGMDLITMGDLHITAHQEGTLLEFVFNENFFVDYDDDPIHKAERKKKQVIKRLTDWLTATEDE